MTLNAQLLTIGCGARTAFGVGTISGLPAAIRDLGATRAFIVTDRGLAGTEMIAALKSRLGGAGLDVLVYSELNPNPAAEDVAAGGDVLRSFGEAVVVGFGGGTAIDCAKGISLAAMNDVPIRELDYKKQLERRGLPVIAVPTTAGTGSETNAFGVIDDHASRRKFYIGNSSVAPRAVILDPALTTSLPPGPTAASGMDALTHALESLMARDANPYAHALDIEVVRAVLLWLPVAFERGQDIEARAQMLLAAHLAGLAFATTGLGLAHALGHTLSALLGTAHGVALAAVLASVMELNLPARTAELASVGLAAGLAASSDPPEAAARAGIDGVRDLTRRLGMPQTLRELGLTANLVPQLVQSTLEDVVLTNNPIQPDQRELEALVASLMGT